MLPVFKTQPRPCRRQRQRRLLFLFAASALLLWVLWPSFQDPASDFENQRHLYFSNSSSIGRVFIAANHYNSEHILQPHWIPAVLALIQLLGKENVFVSIAASKSDDNTFSVLSHLDQILERMGVERRIRLDEESHETLMQTAPEEGDKGWLVTHVGNHKWRRIPFLARARNLVLEPLEDSKVVNGTTKFDKILYLNDIVFTAQDALKLLNTRNGNYAAACAMDFLPNRMFYDTFVMRDSKRRPVADQSRYPYFGASSSRDALLKGRPVPVTSCWNGMAAFDAKPFLSYTQPLRFRAVDDSLAQHHVEASECCLIHADNPESKRKGVWVNPHVRVAYVEEGYLRMRTWPTFQDRVTSLALDAWNDLWGLPWKKRWVEDAVEDWLLEDVRRKGSEPGLFCLEDQMQILTEKSWMRVAKPKRTHGVLGFQWKRSLGS